MTALPYFRESEIATFAAEVLRRDADSTVDIDIRLAGYRAAADAIAQAIAARGMVEMLYKVLGPK